MNKNVLIGIIAVLVVAVLAVGGYILLSGNSDETNNNNNNNVNNGNNTSNDTQNEGNDNTGVSGSNVLVVYYSAQGHTESVAEQIAENLGADLFEIVATDEYTSDDLNWTDSDSRVSREHDDEALRDVELVSTTVDNWEDYGTILIGYPIWWGIAAWPVNTFVEANDFSGKTVIPFCTSSSSGLGQSGEILAELAGTGNWQDGHRFSSNPSEADIKSWTDSLRN